MAQERISVPADFIRELKVPGATGDFSRPARILTDHQLNEIYIADAGNNRIIIFDQNGLYKFEFSTAEQCGAPSDIAVDSAGHIFVMGSTPLGTGLFVFDYNGLFLRQFSSDALIARTQISSIAMDQYDRLYAVDSREKRIIRFDSNGAIDTEFSASPDVTGNLLRDVSYGAMIIAGDTIYLPISSLGVVYCFDLSGNKIYEIGYFGAKPGELNFPVAVAVTSERAILILDKHRYNVSCYSNDGQFLGEFGGKGVSPGWFYHPTWLAIDGNGLIYIGQIFNNKIQICRIPAPIKERINKATDEKSTKTKSLIGSARSSEQLLTKRSPAESQVIYNPNQLNGGISHA